MKIRKIPKVKPETIKSFPSSEADWVYCEKCGTNNTAYFHTEFYMAERKYKNGWDDDFSLCLRCAQVEGWAW